MPTWPVTTIDVPAGGDLTGRLPNPTVKGWSAAGKISSIGIIAHSWNAGTAIAATGTPQFEKQGAVGRFGGLVKVHENNVKHLGISGSSLSRTTTPFGANFGGWAGVFAFVVPYTNRNISDTTTVILADPAVAQPYTWIMTHGINDAAWYGANTNATNFAAIERAWKQAGRAVFARLRCGALFSSYRDAAGAIQWDSLIAFSAGFTNVASIGVNTGPAYRSASATGETVTLTLPPTIQAGDIFQINLLSQQNAWTTLAAAITTNVQSSILLTSATEFPGSGNYLLAIDDLTGSNLEYVLVTAGQGTTNPTISRGQNGTTAVTHLIGAQVTMIDVGANFAVSGTASFASGTIGIQSQGLGGSSVAVTKRYVCANGDAGKTVILTTAGLITGDTYTRFWFDSCGIEAQFPPPLMVERIVRYSYASGYAGPSSAQYESLNTDMAAVAAEFDSAIAITDTDAPIWARSGTLNSLIGSTATSFHITANNPTVFASLLNNNTFCIDGERILATTITNNGAGDFTIDCGTTANRGIDGTTAGIHAAGRPISDATWMHADGIHPNGLGHAIRADIWYQTLQGMTSLSSTQIAIAQGSTSQEQRAPQLRLIDNTYIQPQVTGMVTMTLTLNTVYYIPFRVWEEVIIDGMVIWVVAAGTASSVRLGIMDLDVSESRPGALIAELGSGTTTGAAAVSGVLPGNAYHLLEPGIYYAAVVQQGTTAATARGTGAAAMYMEQFSIVSIPSAAQLVSGYSQTGVTSSLPANASPAEQINSPLIWPHVRKKHYA